MAHACGDGNMDGEHVDGEVVVVVVLIWQKASCASHKLAHLALEVYLHLIGAQATHKLA